MIRGASFYLCTLAAAGCVGPGQPPLLWSPIGAAPERVLLATPVAHPQPSEAERRRGVVAQAKSYLGGAPLRAGGLDFEPDPVGFVRAAYWSAGIDLFDPDLANELEATGMELLYRSLAARGGLHGEQPHSGDLAFFDAAAAAADASDTAPSAVAVVERVEPDGTLTVIGSFAGGPGRVVFNLRRPEERAAADGRRINDELRDTQGEVASAAALFRSFGDPFRSP